MSIMSKENLNNGIEDYELKLKEQLDRKNNLFGVHTDCKPIFVAIVGSYSYGLDLPKSDLDIKGIYAQDLKSILRETKIGQANPTSYKSQLGGGKKKNSVVQSEEKDLSFFELGRYLELLSSNNPNILELLNTPEECIIYKHPIWDRLVESLSVVDVLSKKCFYTFYNYAIQQIKKATGLNKNINNPVAKEKKSPLDFCKAIIEGKSVSLKYYLEKRGLKQKFCGLKNVNNARDLYSLYYDWSSHNIFSDGDEKAQSILKEFRLKNDLPIGYGFKGILKESEDGSEFHSNEIRLSSIPKQKDVYKDEVEYICEISYNKDGYMKYCKEYKKYWDWVENRNEERYNDNISHNQNYDGKNLSHCLRLLYMAVEIAEDKGIIVRRPENQRLELLQIKKGLMPYEEIMEKCNALADELEDKYEFSDLPDKPDSSGIQDALEQIRILLYGIEL
jgi:predicted nucleotidyltransferase